MKQFVDEIPMGRQEDAKDVILKLGCESFGDSLCSTPTLRKLAKSYGKKIIVCSHKPFVFKNNPYVKFHIHSNDFKEEFRKQYEVLETFYLNWSNGMKLKYGSVDIRKIHCINLGFDLKPNEMHCEYHPGPINFEESDESFLNLGGYIVIHISKTWPSRTWSKSNYENLITNINKAGYKVALIGFDQPKEPGSNNYDKSCYNFEDFVFEGVSFLNRTSLDQDFEIIKKANICITCDTGILHLAGCTDTEIIYIGGSIDPALRAPYRHGGQDYKFSFVGGECKIFCGSDPKYCITEHAELNSLPLIAECLEKKPTFECHPTHEQIFKKIAEVNLRNLGEAAVSPLPLQAKKDGNLKRVLVDIGSSALGDSLAWIPYVEEYRLKNNYEVYCSTFRNELYEKSYPEINFIKPGGVVYSCNEVVNIGWREDEETGELYPPLDIRHRSLQETASFCLGLEDHVERKPKIHVEDKERKIEGKYVCVSVQSTNQAKHWNNKGGWNKVVEYLKLLGYKVLCIDKEYDDILEGAINRTSISMQETIADIYNCEFFVGLTSGLSWLSWALGKEVILISGLTDPKTEFYTPYRLINRDVCNSCWNKEKFDKGNWNWCPYHEGTEREFECTKEITFEDVRKEIDKAINFVGLKEKGQKKVLVEFNSSALGDSLAWMPYVEEYRLKNNYEVHCLTYKNELFEKKYPEINFIKPGDTVEGDCDVIKIGWTKDEETGELYPPLDVRNDSLQKTASFCLDLGGHTEIKPKIHIEDKERKIEGKYVCIASQSTCQAKYWNNKGGWNKVVKYLKLLDYKVVCIDKDSQFGIEGQFNHIPEGVINKTKENSENTSLQDRVTDLYNCEFFIGLPSGLSWLAWALGKEVVMISGFSDPKTEFHTPYRLINRDVCNSCWNKEEFDRGNWNWCPYHEGTEREFECTKEITFEMVKKEIDKLI